MSISNYRDNETLDALTRSLGFCPAHGAQAVLIPAIQSSLPGNTLWESRMRFRKRGILRFSGFFPGQEGGACSEC